MNIIQSSTFNTVGELKNILSNFSNDTIIRVSSLNGVIELCKLEPFEKENKSYNQDFILNLETYIDADMYEDYEFDDLVDDIIEYE